MRILFWTNGFWPRIGGVETQGLQFVREMLSRGHQLTVIANRDFPSWKAEEALFTQEMVIRRFDFHEILLKNNLYKLNEIRQYLEDLLPVFQPDIIHLNELAGASTFAFFVFRHLFKVPIILTAHLFLLQKQPIPALVKNICETVDAIGCVSHSLYHQLSCLLPQAKDKLKLIYNGLRPATLQPLPPPISTPTLLCLGRLVADKGFSYALEALVEVRKKHPGASLIIAGDGPHYKTLSALTAQLHLSSHVRFVGPLFGEQVAQIINQATIVIIPSELEPFGLVALEAAQMNRPVVAFQTGGLSEVIMDGETGILTPQGNIEKLSKAITYLIDEPAVACQMGQRAYKYVTSKFTLEAHLDNYTALYEEMIQKRL